MGDILLGLPFILLASMVGTIAGIPFVGLDGLEEFLASDAEVVVPPAMLVCSLIGQQLGQGLWPLVVSHWKGLGPVADWGLRFKPVDLALGVGTTLIALGGATVASAITSVVVDLNDESAADNTQFLDDARGTPWLYLLLALVVIGAPLSEELLFRGLILRSIEKRAGSVAAVIGSTGLFILPHWAGAGPAGTLVLFSGIGVVGIVLGVVTVKVGRLWPAILAHVGFNVVGAMAGLGLFDVAETMESLGV
jgi:membrane protease YdiL (CAAX protease family)